MTQALIFQKTKMMWDVQRIHGSSGKNASIIKAWFRKHVAREARNYRNWNIVRWGQRDNWIRCDDLWCWMMGILET